MKRKTNRNIKDCLYTKYVLKHFPLILNKTPRNETFIYRKFLSQKIVRFIYLGNTIYKFIASLGLYAYCIFDYSQVYKEN